MIDFRVAKRFVVSYRALIKVDQALRHLINIAELTTLHQDLRFIEVIQIKFGLQADRLIVLMMVSRMKLGLTFTL